jgi:hypothetical protein
MVEVMDMSGNDTKWRLIMTDEHEPEKIAIQKELTGQ